MDKRLHLFNDSVYNEVIVPFSWHITNKDDMTDKGMTLFVP